MALTDLKPLAENAMEHRGTITDVVLGVLREAILTGILPEGEELNQVQLAAQFGISRVPVREALRRLEAEGLVVSRAHKRTVVSSLSPRRIEELMEIRVALESVAIRYAVKNLPDAELVELQKLVDQMDVESDTRRWLDLNKAFHQRIYRFAERETLFALAEQIRTNLERYLWSHDLPGDRQAEANQEHQAIVDACRQHDPEAAARALTVHLNGTRDGILQRIRNKT